MKSYASLNAVIATKVDSLKDINNVKIFANVYNNPNAKPNGYPCAFVVDRAGEGDILDTARNEREWQFEITVLQEVGTRTSDEALDIMRTIVDRLVTMFDQDPQIEVSGVQQCMRAKVVPLEFDYIIKEQPFLKAVFVVACVDLVSNF